MNFMKNVLLAIILIVLQFGLLRIDLVSASGDTGSGDGVPCPDGVPNTEVPCQCPSGEVRDPTGKKSCVKTQKAGGEEPDDKCPESLPNCTETGGICKKGGTGKVCECPKDGTKPDELRSYCIVTKCAEKCGDDYVEKNIECDNDTVECKCRETSDGFDYTIRQCKACDCGENAIGCTFDQNGKTCKCEEKYTDKNGKCEACDCGENAFGCTFDQNGKTCKCQEKYADKNGKCEACDCGENAIGCTFDQNGKTCKCEEKYANKNGKCEACDCGENAIGCTFDQNGKTCKCKEKYADKNGKCEACDCGENAIGCTFDQNGKTCKCEEKYAHKNGKCEACDCGENAFGCTFDQNNKTCKCQEKYADKNGKCEDACGGVLIKRRGVITSPNFPDAYPPHERCYWSIVAPPGSRITLNFTHFDLEDDCFYDRVKIQSPFPQNSKWKHEATYCGSQLPPVFVSEGDVLRIDFRSDGSDQRSGFSAQYSISGDNIQDDGATTLTDFSFEATTPDLFITETDYFTETMEFITETVSENPETQSITSLSSVNSTDGYFDESGPSWSNSNAGSTVLLFPSRQSTRKTSPVSDTDGYPIYPHASPRNYLDISIYFPSGQRWPAPDSPRPIDRKPTRNQGLGSLPGYLKAKPCSAQFERDNGRLSVDAQDRNVGKSYGELFPRYADASYNRNDNAPGPLMALLLFSNSYPVNIRVNDQI